MDIECIPEHDEAKTKRGPSRTGKKGSCVWCGRPAWIVTGYACIKHFANPRARTNCGLAGKV